MKLLKKLTTVLLVFAMVLCYAPQITLADEQGSDSSGETIVLPQMKLLLSESPDSENNEAYNETTQTNYATLADAVADASDGDTIVLLRESIELSSTIAVATNLTIKTQDDAAADTVITGPSLNGFLMRENSGILNLVGNENARIVFDGQSRSSRDSALVFAAGGATINAEYTVFQNGSNTTEKNGAGVRVTGIFNAIHCSFIGNSATGTKNQMGGAVYVAGSGVANISYSHFENNYVVGGSYCAAVLRAVNSGHYEVSYSTFIGNTSGNATASKRYLFNNYPDEYGAGKVLNCWFDNTSNIAYYNEADNSKNAIFEGNHTGVIFTNPTSKNASYNGSNLAVSKFFNNWDNNKMQAAVTQNGVAVTPLEPGFYDFTVTAKNGYEFYDQSFDGQFSAAVNGGRVTISGTSYDSLKAAYNAAVDGDVLVLESDIVLDGYQILEKAITITTVGGAANGVTLSCSRDPFNGNLLDIRTAGVSIIGTEDSVITVDGRGKTQTSNALMYVRSSDTTLAYIDFKNITTVTNNAAGIRIHNEEGLDGISVSNCSFANCAVGDAENVKNGGAVLVNTNIEAEFTDCVFENCSANRGGAVFVSHGSDVVFTDCTFEDNTAAAEGGAVYINNAVGQNVYAQFDGCEFVENAAGQYGGAIYLYDRAVADVTGSVFTGNVATANQGGAIYARTAVAVTISEGSSFTANSAGDSGGALYGAGSSSYAVSGSTFINNTVGSYGRAIRSTSAFLFSNCVFNDTLDEIMDCAVSGNTAGAALSRIVTGCAFNTVPSLSVTKEATTGVMCEGCTFVYIGIEKPAVKAEYAEGIDFGRILTAADVLDGFDAESMTATYVLDETSMSAIQYTGTYTITVAPKEDYKFLEGGVQTEDTAVLSLTVNQTGDGEPKLSMKGILSDVVDIELLMIPQNDEIASEEYSSIVFVGNVGDRTVEIPANRSGKAFSFCIDEIYAICMADTVSGTIYGRKAGEEDVELCVLDASEEVSFMNYCGLLAEAYEGDYELLTLLANMLNYGAASQIYKGYNTDNLPNTAAFVAENEQTYSLPESTAVIGEVKEGVTGTFISNASLNLSNRIKVYVVVTTDIIEDITLVVSSGESEWIYTSESSPAVSNGNKYRFNLEKLLPQDYDKQYTIKLYSGTVEEDNLIQTVEYGVYDYIARMSTKTQYANLPELLNAIYNYSQAAMAFVDTH